MGTIQSYKCPSCGAPLTFLDDKLKCDSCGTELTLEALQQLSAAEEQSATQSSYSWNDFQPGAYGEEESGNLSDYICPSCGAQITGDDTMGATVCPYCGNATIVKSQFEGTLRPDFVIPFKLDKKAAMSQFESFALKAPFLPDEFKSRKRIEEMTGVYVPFWMFDCDCNASVNYKASKIKHWSDSNYIYTRVDHFKIIRNGTVGFENIPVDGSKKADDAYMEAVEPFNYNEAVDFNTAYLSGYLADKYDVSAEESKFRANERIEESAKQIFRSTVNGSYEAVTPENAFINFSDGKIRYALLPVWMLNIKYESKNYNFAINGQTGKTVGEFPISKKKRNAYFAKVWGIAAAIGAVIVTVYQFFM